MIEGSVAQILNERELIINRGRKDGVTNGMKFAVLASQLLDISDPETGESLGAVDRPKVRVWATHVQERLSICETYETIEVGGSLFEIKDFFSPRRSVPTTFAARDFPPELSPEESIVKVGDRVRQIAVRASTAVR